MAPSQNLEFKAELRDPEAASRQCALISAQFAGTLYQTDTYFRVADGRLKRRESPGMQAEYIHYRRADAAQPRKSLFERMSEDEAMCRWQRSSLVPWRIVRKQRDLWLLENVRIHIDRVESLGNFLEFEIELADDHHHADDRMQSLRSSFEPILGEPVSCSYVDLIEHID